MKKHNEGSLGMRLWSFIYEWTRRAVFFVFIKFPLQWWASFLVGAISLLAFWHAYDFGQEEIVGIGIAMVAFVIIYCWQSSEIQAYQNTKKRLRWHTPVTDLLFALLVVIAYTLIVQIDKDTRLFTPLIPQMVLHVIGFFAKRRVGRFIDAFY